MCRKPHPQRHQPKSLMPSRTDSSHRAMTSKASNRPTQRVHHKSPHRQPPQQYNSTHSSGSPSNRITRTRSTRDDVTINSTARQNVYADYHSRHYSYLSDHYRRMAQHVVTLNRHKEYLKQHDAYLLDHQRQCRLYGRSQPKSTKQHKTNEQARHVRRQKYHNDYQRYFL